LEELWFKVELGVLSKGQVAKEWEKLLELAHTKVENLAYQSVHE